MALKAVGSLSEPASTERGRDYVPNFAVTVLCHC